MNELLRAFPALRSLDAKALETAVASSAVVQLDPGTRVFEVGQICERFLLVIEGSVRVHLLDVDAHEIVLYRVRAGQTCILTTAALLGSNPYAAFAVTEAPTKAATLPMDTFASLMEHSASFRRFVFAAYGERIVDLMQVVSNVAFTRIQARLARCLLDRADKTGVVSMTHDAIAVELGTAREVVSRNLKLLERDHCVDLHQGYLKLTDVNRLAGLAARPHS